jgi:hypothetical protein
MFLFFLYHLHLLHFFLYITTIFLLVSPLSVSIYLLLNVCISTVLPYSLARKLAPTVIFIDEMDTLLRKREGDNGGSSGSSSMQVCVCVCVCVCVRYVFSFFRLAHLSPTSYSSSITSISSYPLPCIPFPSPSHPAGRSTE